MCRAPLYGLRGGNKKANWQKVAESMIILYLYFMYYYKNIINVTTMGKGMEKVNNNGRKFCFKRILFALHMRVDCIF